MIRKPGSKPRHEKVDVELFTKKKEQDFVEAKQEQTCNIMRQMAADVL